MHGHSKDAEFLRHLFLPSKIVKLTMYCKTTETYSIVLITVFHTISVCMAIVKVLDYNITILQ